MMFTHRYLPNIIILMSIIKIFQFIDLNIKLKVMLPKASLTNLNLLIWTLVILYRNFYFIIHLFIHLFFVKY